jgi:ABC-type molybdate transport system ATPase subunit
MRREILMGLSQESVLIKIIAGLLKPDAGIVNVLGKEVDKNKYPLQTSTTKSIGENLYGFYLISGNQQIITPKTYYIYNTEVSSIKINIKINGLYEQIITGSNAGDVERQDIQLRYAVYRILNNGNLVLLDTSKYPPFEKAYWSIDDILINGKIILINIIYFFNKLKFN